MVRFSYTVYNPITGVYLGQVEPKSPQWVETVNGSGSFTFRVVVPENEVVREGIRTITAPDNSIQIEADNGVIPWTGYIMKRKWMSDSNELEVTALEWRSYLYRVLIAPFDDNALSNTVQYIDMDQLEIARRVLGRETVNGYGMPWFETNGTLMSGIIKSVLVDGRKFASIGSTLDALANSERGFEWDVVALLESDGRYTRRFETYFPQRGTVIEGLEFKYGPGGNILSYEEPEESNEELVRRQWAIGEGPSSDVQPYALDQDPQLIKKLRLDKVTQWKDATNLADLASRARSERAYYGVPLQLLKFTALLDQPHAYTYAKGDRCRLVVTDRWLNLEYDEVRIIERIVKPDDNLIEITVDLNDLEIADVDDEGSV